MIIQEYPYNENTGLIRTFSDGGRVILQNETGIEYTSAVDVYPCRYTYSETDKLIEDEEDEIQAIE